MGFAQANHFRLIRIPLLTHRLWEMTMGDREPAASDTPDDTSDRTDISRRDFLNRACARAAIMGVASLAIAPDAMAEYWVWKSSARYQYYPNGPARCAGCVNFRPYAACAIVEPPISPDG